MATKLTSDIPGLNLAELKLEGFKVHELTQSETVPVSLGRRDFYKMGLVTGETTIYYDDKILEINGTVLFFVNPHVPHSVLRRSRMISGFACLFTEDFISGRERSAIIKDSPLFCAGETPRIPLTGEQAVFMKGLFEKMLALYHSSYQHKGEMVKNCIELIIHEALRIQPSTNTRNFKNAASRITHRFVDLLERQFPIERAGEPLKLRTAQDFADNLSVHINYLNRSVKEVTGKSTSVHIAERITAEAKALLKFSDCSIAEIADVLGFEYPTYFNNYFKRITGTTPNSFRKQKV